MEPFVLVVLGGTGNLAKIKLLPALYDITKAGYFPDKSAILGVGRTEHTDSSFRTYVDERLHTKVRHHEHDVDETIIKKLLERVFYLQGDITNPDYYSDLKTYLDSLQEDGLECKNRIFYLATYPDLYETIFNNLQTHGLNDQSKGWSRVLVEKPIGTDLKTAQRLDQLLLKYYTEDQIFRLDHYLGKDTLQNILTFRFGNSVFEPLINREYVDHIQITAAEEFGIEDRGGYYDTTGALKDVGQNHILQMLALAFMQEPVEYSNPAITKERIKLIQSLKPDPEHIIYGQYKGYLAEKNVDPHSKTDSFFAFKTEIQNEKFMGVPIYVRGGKKLARTVTEISIIFKPHKRNLFAKFDKTMDPNVLIYRVQPNEGIVLKILAKTPSHKIDLEPTYMQFCYHQLSHSLPDAYERLLLDAIKGDQTFFNDAPEIEAQWKFIDPLVSGKKKVFTYDQNSWGPKEAFELIEKDGRSWLEPSDMFCSL